MSCENSNPNTDTTNDSLCNSSTGASEDNNNDKNTSGTKTAINIYTNKVTINDDGNNGEEAGVETATNSAELNSKNNNGIGSSNSKSNYVDTKILKCLNKKNKKRGNNVGFNGDNSSEKRESQKQKWGNLMPIANNRSQIISDIEYTDNDNDSTKTN